MRLVFFLQKNCLQAQNISVSELDGIGISYMYSYFVVKNIHIIAECWACRSSGIRQALDSNGSVWGVVSSMLRVVALRKALDVLQLFIYWSTSAITQTEWKGLPILKNLAWAWRSIQWSRLIPWELFNVEKQNLSLGFQQDQVMFKDQHDSAVGRRATTWVSDLAQRAQGAQSRWSYVPRPEKDIEWLRTPRMPKKHVLHHGR